MTLALTAGALIAGAVYLFLQREMFRVILGFVLVSHGANLIIIAAGGTSRRDEPFGSPSDSSTIADPLPQAFVLTAIVIAFSITIFMLVLSVTGSKNDDTTEGAVDGSSDGDGGGGGDGAGDDAEDPGADTGDSTSDSTGDSTGDTDRTETH